MPNEAAVLVHSALAFASDFFRRGCFACYVLLSRHALNLDEMLGERQAQQCSLDSELKIFCTCGTVDAPEQLFGGLAPASFLVFNASFDKKLELQLRRHFLDAVCLRVDCW